MLDWASTFWLFVIVGGPALIGIVVVWAILRNRGRSRAQVAAGERETRKVYDEQPPGGA